MPIKTRETGDGENSICADKELARANEGPAHGNENLGDRWRRAPSPLKPGDKTGRTGQSELFKPGDTIRWRVCLEERSLSASLCRLGVSFGVVDDSLQKVPVDANGLLAREGGCGLEFEQIPAGDDAGDDGDRLRHAFLTHDSRGKPQDVGRAAPLLDDDPGVLACEGGIFPRGFDDELRDLRFPQIGEESHEPATESAPARRDDLGQDSLGVDADSDGLCVELDFGVEIVVDKGRIDVRRPRDGSQRRRPEAPFVENLPGGVEDLLPCGGGTPAASASHSVLRLRVSEANPSEPIANAATMARLVQ